MKTTILGIEVGRKAIWQFKNYIENKKREERLGREDKWSVGYSYAYTEISLTEARKAGTITEEQEKILKKFLMNLEFPKTRESIYEKKNWF